MALRIAAILLVVTALHAQTYADDAPQAQEPKVKSLDIVSDTAVTVIRKTSAFFNGNLDITMSSDADKYKYRNEYSVDAIGRKVPKATAVRSAGALSGCEKL